MMKQLFFFLICFSCVLTGKAQVVAYPSINESKVLGASCVDLHYVNPIVIGHQINVTVSYYESLTDAQNGNNPLDRFYEQTSNPQTIFARVDNIINSDFAIAESIIVSAVSSGTLPPGISPCDFDVCDVDSDGTEIIYLDNLRCNYNGYGFPTSSFCASSDSEVVTTYYETETDALNETNPVNPIYTITGTQTFYRKVKNTTTNEFLVDDLLTVHMVTCTTDTDGDGIMDMAEDANRNLLYTDDDTDLDGLKNFEDDDDDGDGILTIDEDYNNNGDPTDDDTNSNGIPDYLESSVTLSIINLSDNLIKIYPNPVKQILSIQSQILIQTIYIYSDIGQLIEKQSENTTTLNLSKYASGLYFIKIEDVNGGERIIKFVKE